MRYLLPMAASAAVLTIGVSPAPADTHHSHQRPERARSHLALHLSGHTALAGKGVAVHGRVRPGGKRRIKVVLRGPDPGVFSTTTAPSGAFLLRWTPERTGEYSARAFGVHDRRARGAVSETRRLTAYRLAGASYYGPGLYGNGVACGGTLMPDTIGVANKTLPCGTKVKFRYRGRTVTAPVIDRGPYVAGRDFDLTEAVKERLGFPGVGTVLASR